ncbi:hypothetical protein STAS_16263 [Striga asiatica]|uniref:KIB1-4 beta-propeller domain-containing protein n=1 Tax=Striga asiatica TaxID=4170 RepID=A0A5A7Q423_STRAF|nr:hypothetical protein STAS_16263 [Striga asiatica]
MASSSSFSIITRSIGRKWFTRLSNHPIVWMIGSCSSSVCPKGMSTLSENPSSSSSSSPWLMLPPAYDGTAFDLFLYNPISGRRINLPSVRELPDHNGTTELHKVILSCSPEDPNCRAIILYNSVWALAFCCPAFSKEWTHIGDHHWLDEKIPGRPFSQAYMNCVYSKRHEALFSLTKKGVLEAWDIWDPHSPRAVKIADVGQKGTGIRYKRTTEETTEGEEEDEREKETQHFWITCKPVNHLDVYQRGLLSVTVDFSVDVYDPEDKDFKSAESLGGWAVFVGHHSDAVALRVGEEFPELKPNSIYFTDVVDGFDMEDHPTGGHDIGIFDYENMIVSSCYYPCHLKNMTKTFPPPMWFFPSSD